MLVVVELVVEAFKVEGRWNGRLVQTVREEKDVVANKGFDWKVND